MAEQGNIVTRAFSRFVAGLNSIGGALIFAMIVNNYDETRQSAEYLQDLALEYLSHFSRKSRPVS